MNAKSNHKIHIFLYGVLLAGIMLFLCLGVSGSPAVHAQEAKTPEPNGSGTDYWSFTTAGTPTGLFNPYVTYPVGSAQAVGVGDFNNDGLNDVAVTTSAGELKILLQNDDGSLASPIIYAAGSRPESLAVGDLNHDGLDDIVVTNSGYGSTTIGVFLQQADGTLAARTIYSTGSNPEAVAVGDVNGDGLDDIAVAHWSSSYIGIFTQTVSGTLNAMVTYTSPQAGYDDIAIGDVNGDGLNDVVKMNGQLYANPDLSVYLQTGSGTLASAVSYSLPGNILGQGIGIGDVTGDGKADVVMSYGGNSPSAFVAVFAQALDGSLQSPVSYSAYDIPDSVEVADVNFDGLADAVIAHGGWEAISVYPQKNNGTLESYSLYGLPEHNASHYKPQGLAIGDINHDDAPDVLIADYNFGLVILYHQPLYTGFGKTSPTNGVADVSTSPSLSWASSAGATGYEYCYYTTDSSACDGSWTSAGTNTTANLLGLNNGTTYYWQVRAKNAGGTTDADGGTWWSFTTKAACYTLTRAHTGSGSDPTASPTNSGGCSSGQYHAGESISLTASPAVGWAVGSWSGTNNDTSTTTTNSVSMPSSNRTVTANYTLSITYRIYLPLAIR